MSEKYKPEEGDRVRVVLEGEVAYVSGGDFEVGAPFESNYIRLGTEHVVSVEKLEPPVTVFKPGDRLRSTGHGIYEVTLGDSGYLQHYSEAAGGGVEYYGYAGNEREVFTSENYELLELVPKPF